MLFKSKRKDIINESLSKIEVQPKISIGHFRTTVFELTALGNQEIIDEHYRNLMEAPIRNWVTLLKEWVLDERYGLKQNEPLEDYIKELAERTKGITKPQMKELSKGRL